MIDMEEVDKAYNKQIENCRYKVDALGNPVEMKMTLQQYHDIWDQSGQWHLRGYRKGQYCMARHNDIGHYEVGNVKIILQSENTSEAHKGKPKPGTSAAKKGIPRSEATKAKISASKTGKPSPKTKTQCVHCGTWASPSNMKRWHGDNCKRKP